MLNKGVVEMMNFYTQEEFEGQMVQLMIAEGVDRLQAFRIVSQREQADAAEYERWLDAQIAGQEIYHEFGWIMKINDIVYLPCKIVSTGSTSLGDTLVDLLPLKYMLEYKIKDIHPLWESTIRSDYQIEPLTVFASDLIPERIQNILKDFQWRLSFNQRNSFYISDKFRVTELTINLLCSILFLQ